MKLRFFLLIASCVFVFPACTENVATNQPESADSDTQSAASAGDDDLDESNSAGLIVSDSILERPEFSMDSSDSLDSSEGQIRLMEYSQELKDRKVKLSGENW